MAISGYERAHETDLFPVTESRAFRGWAGFTLQYPWFILLVALLSVALSLRLASQNLKFSTDRTQLLDPDHPVQRRWQAYREQFEGNSDLLVLLTGSPVEVRAAADELGGLLDSDRDYFDEVFYKVEIPEISHHALYFLSRQDLKRLLSQLQRAAPWIDSMSTGLPGLLQKLGSIPVPQARPVLEPVLPLFLNILRGLNEAISSDGRSPYKSPLPAFRPEAALLREQPFNLEQTTFYNAIDGARTCLMLVQPSDLRGNFDQDAATVARLRQQVSRVQRSFPQVQCRVSGETVMNTDEMVGSYNDSRVSGLLALIMVYLLLAIAFVDLLRPLCAVLSLGVGLAWSLAFTSMAVGYLNLLTVHFATIVAGLSMTFAILLLCQYLELGASRPELKIPDLLIDTMVEIGPTSLIGAVTTAIAFWSLQFTNFRAASELGLITGTGVFLCFCSVNTLLPILLVLTEGQKKFRAIRLPGWSYWSGPLHKHPYRVLGISLFISLYCLTWVPRVPFNYNVLTLQPVNSEPVRVEKFLQTMGYSGLFAVTSAPNMSQAYRLAQRFEALSSVSRVETIASLQPQGIEAKRPLVKEIVALAQPGQGPEPQLKLALSASELGQLGASFGHASDHLGPLLRDLPPTAQVKELQNQLHRFEKLLDPSRPGPLVSALLGYQQQLAQDLRKQADFLQHQSATPPDILRFLPKALKARSVSADGRISLRIFPHANCWDREPQEYFVHQLESVDPEVTGSPLLIYYYSQALQRAYVTSGRNGLAVIFVLLLLHFRSLGNAALAIFPKLLGVLWMVGAMGVAGVSFNSANFLALPITLGIGLIFGVNVLLECQQKSGLTLFRGPTGAAVVLSGLTAILGFSSFLMVSHRGVSSFGFVMAAGLGANLLTSLLTLPALISLLKPKEPQSSPESLTAKAQLPGASDV